VKLQTRSSSAVFLSEKRSRRHTTIVDTLEAGLEENNVKIPEKELNKSITPGKKKKSKKDVEDADLIRKESLSKIKLTTIKGEVSDEEENEPSPAITVETVTIETVTVETVTIQTITPQPASPSQPSPETTMSTKTKVD